MADRHVRNPITYRPPSDTAGWLEDIAEREGRPVRKVVGDAVERARRVDEAGLAAFDREQDRRFTAWHAAMAAGEDGGQELAALDAAMEAYQAAIRRWRPPQR
jgi:hypothetical protein